MKDVMDNSSYSNNFMATWSSYSIYHEWLYTRPISNRNHYGSNKTYQR